jgi:AcrR family transcriptional regulator
MTPRILNEQSLLAREQQIIDAAVELIAKDDIEHLTMDKVVAKVPYSKGTVYKHFIGKEDLLLAINNKAMRILNDLFFRAAQLEGCARAKMLLLNMSYLIFAILHPALFKTMLCSRSPNIYGKSSEQMVKQQEQLEAKLLGTIFAIFERAINEKMLVLPKHMDMQQVCFANWSMGFGTISLLSAEVEKCSGASDLVVEREIFNQNNLLFDGLQWRPLTQDKAHDLVLKDALQQIFPTEIALMKSMGRELNFAS